MAAEAMVEEMTPGQWLVLGMGADGTMPDRPREGVVGLDLETGYRGGPWPDELLETVYVGVPMSAMPEIARKGLRPSLRIGDIRRQTAWLAKHPKSKFAAPGRRVTRCNY